MYWHGINLDCCTLNIAPATWLQQFVQMLWTHIFINYDAKSHLEHEQAQLKVCRCYVN